MIRELYWKKGQRYYRLARIQTLFSKKFPKELTIQLAWGRENTRLGNEKTIFCENRCELYKFIENIRKIRKARGYELISEK